MAEHVALQLLIVAVIKKVKSMGPKMSPCLTPILLLMGSVISSSSIFTENVECSAFKMLTSLIGTPYFNKILHKRFLGTLSNALTRSRKSTHDSNPCSLLFLIADLIVNIASIPHRYSPVSVGKHIVVRGPAVLQWEADGRVRCWQQFYT